MNTGENDQIFRLQQRFIYLEMLFLCTIASLCIISWFPSIFSILVYEMIIKSALKAAVFLNFTALVIFLLYKHIKKEMYQYTIMFSDDQIIKRGFFETTAIHFSEITGVKYVRLPLIKGYLEITTNSKPLIIWLYIENPAAFVSLLQTKLSLNISDKYLNEDLSVFHDSYKRSVSAFYPLTSISLLTFFINVIISIKFWDLALIPILLFAMTGLILPIIAYTIADIKLNCSIRNLLRSDSAVIPDSRMEYLFSSFLIFIFYLLLGIFFKAIFLW